MSWDETRRYSLYTVYEQIILKVIWIQIKSSKMVWFETKSNRYFWHDLIWFQIIKSNHFLYKFKGTKGFFWGKSKYLSLKKNGHSFAMNRLQLKNTCKGEYFAFLGAHFSVSGKICQKNFASARFFKEIPGKRFDLSLDFLWFDFKSNHAF